MVTTRVNHNVTMYRYPGMLHNAVVLYPRTIHIQSYGIDQSVASHGALPNVGSFTGNSTVS